MKSKTHDREKGHHAYLAVAALILCATLWSFSGPLIKLLSGAGGHISPTSGIAIAFYRSLIGGLFFLPLAWSNRRSMGNVQRRWLVGSVASFTLMTGFFVIATTQTAAANAIVLQNTSAIWVFLLSPILLHERPSLTEGAVLLLAMTGVIIVFTGNGATDMSGLVIAMISGLGYGVLTVVLRALRPVDALVVVCMNCLGSSLLLLPLITLFDTFALNLAQLAIIVALSLIQFSIPYLLFTWSLKHIEAHKAAIILLLEVILNPTWTYLFIGEPVPPATLAGGPLILLSIAAWIGLTWINHRETRGT